MDYYNVLFFSSESSVEAVSEFLGKLDILQLSEEDQRRLEEPIQLKEVIEAINSLKQNRAPGNDGLTGEFYKKFQEQLGTRLQRLFSACLIRNRIPNSWLEARIVVIPKLDRGPVILQDYRPISLLTWITRF